MNGGNGGGKNNGQGARELVRAAGELAGKESKKTTRSRASESEREKRQTTKMERGRDRREKGKSTAGQEEKRAERKPNHHGRSESSYDPCAPVFHVLKKCE